MKIFSVLWIALSCGIAMAQTAPATPAPMGSVEVLARLMGTSSEVTKSYRVERLVRQRGLSFNPTDDYLRFVKTAGGLEPLLEALRVAGRPASQEHGSASQPRAVPDSDAATLSPLVSAIELWDRHSYKDSEKDLRAALIIEPGNVYLHLSLATILSDKGDKKAAVEECHRAIQLQPDCADAHAALARLLDSPKDPAKAMPEYQEALRLEPDYASVRFRIGFIMLQQGNLDGAIALYREGLRLAQLNPGLHHMLGEALEKKGDMSAALDELRTAAGLPVDGTLPTRVRADSRFITPKLIHGDPPAYPFGAKESGIHGAVELDVLIGRDGSVAEVTVLSGSPLLVPSAVEAVRKWRFQPPLVNGSPVEVLAKVEVGFKFYTPLNL